MKKIVIYCLSVFSMLLFSACTEKIVMDVPEGRKRPVVEGYFTDELKCHEVILSYSSEFYSDDMEMISGA